MQLSDLTSKTPEELNVICAELLGWKCTGVNADNHSVWTKDNWTWVQANALPNYTGSWDAIMPEVRKLTEDQFINYLVHLTDVADATQIGQFRAHYDSRLVTIALILTLTSQH